MSIRLYDQAITEKIQKWVQDPNMSVLGPDQTAKLLQMRADQTKDKPISLPLIAISRDRNIPLILTNKRIAQFEGRTFNGNKDTIDHLNHVPIQLNYQLDIYTKFFEEADEYVRNFVFSIISHPKIVIEIPYNDSKLSYTCFMELREDIADNSDIPERLMPTQFYRMTLRFTLQDAQLFSYNTKSTKSVQLVGIEANKDLANKQPSFNNDSEWFDVLKN